MGLEITLCESLDVLLIIYNASRWVGQLVEIAAKCKRNDLNSLLI